MSKIVFENEETVYPKIKTQNRQGSTLVEFLPFGFRPDASPVFNMTAIFP
jgi:hypothetical protein